jgi:serine/threonine-protein kinase
MAADEQGLPVEPEGSDSDHRDDDEGRRKWLPWVGFAVVVLVVLWLIWHYTVTPASSIGGGGSRGATVTVPNVTGLFNDDAARVLVGLGLAVEVDTDFNTDEDPGRVVSQKPKKGTKVQRNSIVIIRVAGETGSESGVATGGAEYDSLVPDVVGMTQLQATDKLERSGFTVSVVEAYDSKAPGGMVFMQAPAPNTPVSAGTAVSITLSLGDAPAGAVKVPALIGLKVDDAVKKVEDAGLDPQSLVQPKSDSAGVVYEQSPAEGERVPQGSKVFILSGEVPGK